MKKTILLIALAAGAISTSQATITYQIGQVVTNSVSTADTAFEFAQFNTGLGTLSAVQIFINSSVDSGGFTVNNKSANGAKVYSPTDVFGVTGPASYSYNGGVVRYSTDPTLPSTRPATNNLAALENQTYTIGDTDVLAAGRDEQSVASGDFYNYEGAGSVYFTAFINPTVSVSGNSYETDMSGILNTTVMEVIYTYDVSTVPVPEPSQVAASLLLVAGIAGFLIVRRRQALVA